MAEQWRPTANGEALWARAQLYQQCRDFFTQRGYLEVEVPCLGRGGTTDRHLHSFQTHSPEHYYLQTSPEFAMKRLLAAGSGPIFAIAKAFRREEAGRYHNPEFTLLEWYRPGFDDQQLMTEVTELLMGLLPAPVERLSYRTVFQQYLGVDPHTVSLAELQALAKQHLDFVGSETDRDFWLELLFSHCIQPKLHDKWFLVFDYPQTQAALARLTEDAQGQTVARRFEVFYRGIELANGYWELTDADEQAERFAADNQQRRIQGLPVVTPDSNLIDALFHGLPDCAGVALGLDRLLMLITGAQSIQEVLAFPVDRV